jgi:hypothetical protein
MVAEDASRLLCVVCITNYADRKTEDVRPAITIWQGKALCWTHLLEFSNLGDKLKVEYYTDTFPPSYSISRKN